MSDKTEYEQAWVDRIQAIEVAISENLIAGRTPDMIIGTDRTLQELCDYLEVIPDWRNTEGRAICFGDEGEVVLRMYRVVTVDMPYGNLIIK